MAALMFGYPASPELKQENGYNAVLVVAANAAAAKTAAIAAKPNGSTDDTKINAWTYFEVAAADGVLPNGSTVMWLDGVRGIGAGRAI